MPIPISNNRRSQAVFGAMLLTIAALFISRGALSVSLFLFVGVTSAGLNFKQQLRQLFQNPMLWSMCLLFLLPFISGLWSSDLNKWGSLVRIKLPLLILPFAFAGRWQLSAAQWRVFAYFFLALVLLGTAWSFENYWADRQAIADSYLQAKVFVTPLQNDHVRFSWLVAVAALLSLFLWQSEAKILRAVLLLLLLWFGLYLHVLAARTGLLLFYMVLIAYAVYNGWRHRQNSFAAVAAIFVFALPFLAWQWLPTFANRVRYFRYDYSFIKEAKYLPGGNDGARMLSLRAGWHILKTHPFGVGAGDVFGEADAWYTAHVPQMLQTDKLYPSSEWLLYGGSTGWPGVAVFTAVMCIPFLYAPQQHRFYWHLLCAAAGLSFLFDIGLEVQYGVFLYAFIVLWWAKWFGLKRKALHHEK